ncbi:electron transfer flavoprotein-ubiquinone oxidoreductase [Croceibacterium sp. TMG7-5b_MA50]|uniref:electron transfer flavoprotein-ubiquinone oxidoreductase n=1 Tax=Croceibacterium sp. TMG7-5b_MA50 TaxID=3121290 RepID=UPI0032215594
MNQNSTLVEGVERETMPVDVVIVGAGPAGLSAAIRLKQIDDALEVVVLEKGSEVGAHILSGAVIDPRALDELLPDWRESCPLADMPVTGNHHWVLTRGGKYEMPHLLMPPLMSNDGNYTGSLANLTRWLGEQAEALGVQVFPGFPAADLMWGDDGAVIGVVTQDMGVGRDGTPKDDYQPGMGILAKQVLIAEGVRGSLARQLKTRFDLEADCQPQVYGLGVKELWDIDPAKHEPGKVVHTQGWPLSEHDKAWGGGFLYHQAGGQVALGYVTALDYANPYISPFQEFQRWKQHPAIRTLLEGGKRVAYGAKAINEGGWQSVPRLAFPGGMLVGCSAGFVNVPRIKGTHTAMKSGMLAAEAAAASIAAGEENVQLDSYDAAVRSSWIAEELKKVQNAQPLVTKFGGEIGTVLAGADMWLRTAGIRLGALGHHPDHAATLPAHMFRPIAYPKPDNVVSFDRLSSVFLSGTNHEEDQPSHLTLKDPAIPREVNFPIYAGPEQFYCPAGVYEYTGVEEGRPELVINAQNCVHCKTCDIKDPRQNIVWVTPEGGGGPNYPNM